MKTLREKCFVVVDMNSGRYVIDKDGHECFNLEMNPIDGRYYGYCPPYDGVNIKEMDGKSSDKSVSNVLVIYTSKAKGSNNREIIAFCDNATVHSKGVTNENLKRILGGNEVTYSIESDYMYDLRNIPHKFTIDISKYSVSMFRRQRFYKGTYEDLDNEIYDYLEAYIANIGICNDLIFQNETQTIDSSNFDSDNSKQKPTYSVSRNGKQVVKNSRISKSAIAKANYECAGDKSHTTFKTEIGNIYMEGHHFIPCTASNAELFWDRDGINIDCMENIVCLCPTCHRLVHFGSATEQHKLLEKIYTHQIKVLNGIGIKISFDELIDLYRK